MDSDSYSPLATFMAGLGSVARERATIAKTRRPPRRVPAVSGVDAVAAIGNRGDDAGRRDKHAETPDRTNFDA